MIARFGFLSFCLLLSAAGFSQSFVADTTTVARAVANLTEEFYQTKRPESFISLGSDYSEYEAIENEHPFFLDEDWIIGTVRYNGIIYSDVPLQYDIRSQKLLTEHIPTGGKIEMVQDHVSWFKINGHHFAFLKIPSSPGYYELLQDGSTAKLWAAHKKSFHESTVTGTLKVRTEEDVKYFVSKGNSLTLVKGKATILAALQDKKEKLKQELRINRVNFKNKPAGLIDAVRLYNSIH